MARGDFYLVRFDDREAVTYTDFEQALEAYSEVPMSTVLLISGDGIWSDETLDFGDILARRDPEAAACERADHQIKSAKEMAW